MKRLILLAVVALLSCGCAQKEDAEETSGRYVEERVELPDEGTVYAGLVQKGVRYV